MNNDPRDLDRAVKAESILNSAIYQESYASVRAAILEKIEKCPLADAQTAEDLRRCLKLLRDVKANLEMALVHGKVATFNLEQAEQRRKNPLRNLFR